MKRKTRNWLITIVIVIVSVYALIRIIDTNDRIEEAKKSAQKYKEQAEELQKENEDLQYDIDHAEDPEVLERVARDKLGLVMPEDKLVIDEQD